MRRLGTGLAMALLAVSAALAQGSAAPAAPAASGVVVDEARLLAFTAELRCVVCQNESLADSTAPLAMDLKREIRRRLEAGQSEAEVQAYLVARYGDFVRYRPPWRPATWLLWAGPLLFALAGVVVVRGHARRNAGGPAPVGEEPGA